MLRLRCAGRDRGLSNLYSSGFSSCQYCARSSCPTTTGLTDIRQIAVSRLLLDNFSHIKAYWQMMTAKIAQIALRFGADDIDGTVVEEKIYHDAGATTPQGMRRSDLTRLSVRRVANRWSGTRFTAASSATKTPSPSRFERLPFRAALCRWRVQARYWKEGTP